MPPSDASRVLCVSIHDVAPQTWPQCECLLRTIADVAAIPVTLLVVPFYHRSPVPVACRAAYERALERRLARGDELALHGYTHLDEGPPPRNVAEHFRRWVYTRREGEFAALEAGEARRRIDAGLAWFAQREWPVAGFVAPAWLLGSESWSALREFPFLYTTTLRRFHLLPQRRMLWTPNLHYAARNAAGRLLSRCRNARLASAAKAAPLVRFGLHPADAQHPELLDDCRRRLERLLADRQAATKIDFALHASSGGLSRHQQLIDDCLASRIDIGELQADAKAGRSDADTVNHLRDRLDVGRLALDEGFEHDSATRPRRHVLRSHD
ncbi:MAG TPA: polysaccharide deacetylase family protein [Paucimonas sp.]|nr:polysaccharide deacetylase family protein [Paucimonas sp.]